MTDEIVELAQEVANALRNTSLVNTPSAIMKALREEGSAASRLAKAMQNDESFGYLRGGCLAGWDFSHNIQDYELPYDFIFAALHEGSASNAVKTARAFAASGVSGFEWYSAVTGLKPTKALSLKDGVDLVPWDDVPDSDRKAVFGGQGTDDLSLAFRRAKATAAVRIRVAKRQVLFQSLDDAEKFRSALTWEKPREAAENTVRCATALTCAPMAIIGSWVQFDTDFPNALSGSGSITRGPSLFDWSLSFAEPVTVGPPIIGLYLKFTKLPPDDQTALGISLDRLAQALRRDNSIDKAIDLGIALEAVLLHGLGDTGRGELKFRAAIRGATFIGGSREKRLETLRLLQDAYDLRSTAVHSGKLGGRKHGKTPEEILDAAATSCAAIAQQLITRGAFPDWDKEFVIGQD